MIELDNNTEYSEINTIRLTNSNDLHEFINDTHKISLYHSNIRSISKNFNELQVLLANLEIDFDVIAVTESWINNNCSNFLLDGYNTYYSEGNINKNDGVIAFVKSEFSQETRIVQIGKIQCLRVHIRKAEEFCITVIYSSPSVSLDSFIEDFRSYLQSHCTHQNEIIVGDININIMSENDLTTTYINSLYENGFISCINTYTRSQQNINTCIDHIFLKSRIKTETVIPIVYESTITDHFQPY